MQIYTQISSVYIRLTWQSRRFWMKAPSGGNQVLFPVSFNQEGRSESTTLNWVVWVILLPNFSQLTPRSTWLIPLKKWFITSSPCGWTWLLPLLVLGFFQPFPVALALLSSCLRSDMILRARQLQLGERLVCLIEGVFMAEICPDHS